MRYVYTVLAGWSDLPPHSLCKNISVGHRDSKVVVFASWESADVGQEQGEQDSICGIVCVQDVLHHVYGTHCFKLKKKDYAAYAACWWPLLQFTSVYMQEFFLHKSVYVCIDMRVYIDIYYV
jgi:hypothetical protein